MKDEVTNIIKQIKKHANVRIVSGFTNNKIFITLDTDFGYVDYKGLEKIEGVYFMTKEVLYVEYK